MIRRGRINWILLIVVLVALAAVTVTFVGLRTWNRTHRSKVGLEHGTEAYETRQWKEAALYLGQYLAMNPQDVPVLLQYAEAQLKIRPIKRSNVEQAIRAYNQILRLQENREAAALLMEVYLQSGDYAEAVSLAKDFLNRTYDSRVSLLLAEVYVRQDNLKEAVAAVQTILKQDPACIEAYQIMGQLAEKDPSLSSRPAAEWFDEGIKAAPGHPRGYLFRAAYAERKGQVQQAGDDLNRAETLTFKSVEDRFRLASLYLLLGEQEKAARQLGRAQQEDPYRPILWKLWARWASQTGDPNDMIRVARRGLETMRPDHFDFLDQAAELYIRAADYEAAQTCITELQTMQPDSPSVVLLEGLLADARQQWSEAAGAWRKLMASSRKTEKVQARLAYALEMMGDPIAAIQEYRNLVMMSPEHADAHRQLARLLSEQERFSEALEHARRAARLLPDEAAVQNMYRKLQLVNARGSQDLQQWLEWNSEIAEITDEQQRLQMQLILIQNKIARQMLDEAAGDLRVLAGQVGPTLQVRLLEAELLTAQKKTAEAEAVLKYLVREYPESIEALSALVSFYTDAGSFEKAEQALRNALPRFPDSQDRKRLAFWLAEIEHRMGNTPQAIERLKELAAQNPDDILICRQLLKISRKTAPVQELQNWIDRIRRIEGAAGRQYRFEQAYVWYERGDFQKEYPRIVALLRETLRDYPEDQSSRVLLAASHQKIGNLRLAVSTYREALDRDPYNLDLIAAAVGVMYQVEDYRQAEEVLARTAGLGINDARLSHLQLQRLLKEGKYTPAGSILENMLMQSPENTDVKLSLALIRLYNNQIGLAESLIREILSRDPRFLPAIAAQVEVRLQEGKPDEAVQICDRAVTELNSAQALTLRALTLAKIGRLQEAAEDVERMIETFENSADNLILASDLYHYLGQVDRAWQLARRAMEKAPDDFTIVKKATVLASLAPAGRPNVESLLKRALDMNPEDAQMRLLKADVLLRNAAEASIEEALGILNNLLIEYPRSEAAWVTLANWTLRQGQTGRAMDQILQGLGHLPNSKALLMLKARVESERSVYLALPTLEFLYELDSRDGRTVARLAQAHLELNQPDQAVELLENSRRQPNVSPKLVLDQLLVNALYQAGRKEQAQSLFEEMMKDANARPGALAQWAQVLIKAGQWDSLSAMLHENAARYPDSIPIISEVCLEIGMEEDAGARAAASDLRSFLEGSYPDSEPVNLMVAQVHHFAGDMDGAVRCYRKVLDANPDHVTALNNLAWILCTETQDYERALRMADHGLQLNPQHTDLLDTRGEIYYSLGMYDKAAVDFRKAVRLYEFTSPQKAQSCYRLVRALVQLGQGDQVREQIRYALQLNQASGALSVDQEQELELLAQQLPAR